MVLLKTTAPEAVESLLYGMAISYATLPKAASEEARRFAKECEGRE
jgi:hypothetical protein